MSHSFLPGVTFHIVCLSVKHRREQGAAPALCWEVRVAGSSSALELLRCVEAASVGAGFKWPLLAVAQMGNLVYLS